jgi:hypothetical protein
MAYANSVFAGLDIRIPHVAMPKLRRPRLSQRSRALLMMGVMVSPVFLADQIGYCVQRLFMTADQIAVRQAPDSTMLSRVNIFHVACVNADAPEAERASWAKHSAQRGWPLYPQAGPDCFQPDKNLFGIAGLTAFNVACPSVVLSVADQRRWVAFAANHGWTDYAQAGTGCVDP